MASTPQKAPAIAPANQKSGADMPWIISYLTLRKTVGLLGVSLVPVLVIGSFIIDHLINGQPATIQTSVSAYYYTDMRNELEGIIFGIGMFLLCYDGYNRQDSIISKLAGLFGLCIALFPTSPTSEKGDIISVIHYVTAGIFFALLAYMSVFLFTKSSGYPTPQKVRRNRIYRICGIVMAVTVIGIPIDGITSIWDKIGFLHPTLILELLALTSFGTSWLTKGEFWVKDKATAL
jgi:hypothetical protein